MKRGEIWLIDLGLAAKACPAVILSIPFRDNEKAVVTYVARSLQRRGGRFEVDHQAPHFRPGVFDAQNIGTVPTAKLIRRLADCPRTNLQRSRRQQAIGSGSRSMARDLNFCSVRCPQRIIQGANKACSIMR
jgi:mRNA interferase MazF